MNESLNITDWSPRTCNSQGFSPRQLTRMDRMTWYMAFREGLLSWNKSPPRNTMSTYSRHTRQVNWGYVMFSCELHDFVEGFHGVVSSDWIAFCVAYMVVCCHENANCVCPGWLWHVRSTMEVRGRYRTWVQQPEQLVASFPVKRIRLSGNGRTSSICVISDKTRDENTLVDVSLDVLCGELSSRRCC